MAFNYKDGGHETITVSIPTRIYSQLKEDLRNHGDQSRKVSEALDLYYSDAESRKIDKIKLICTEFRLQIVPLINNEARDDWFFVIKKCRDVFNLKCNQFEVDGVLREIYPEYFVNTGRSEVVTAPTEVSSHD